MITTKEHTPGDVPVRKEDLKHLNVGKITKMVLWTDIHFGARNNSDQHNQDCISYVEWLVERIKQESASHIAFLGDFFENRNAINVRTLDFAIEACRKINDLGIPVIFIIGNHDLYHRSSRSIFSTSVLQEFNNFHLISEPTVINDSWIASPFLFKEEYKIYAGIINEFKYVLGHFEFRDFVVTGATRTLDHGPDPSAFTGPTYIFSGHFHKRQFNKNIIYIGNTFPTNFGDAGDTQRGCAVHDVQKNNIYFYDWADAPLYFKCTLSEVLSGCSGWPKNSRVRCVIDQEIKYSDVQLMKDEMLQTYNLREFSVQEDLNQSKSLLQDSAELDPSISSLDTSSLDTIVRQLILQGVQPSPVISPEVLVSIYEEL